MKLAHLEVCNAVLLAGSVTGAARMLHVSQPAVTKLLQSAENQLGFKLFTREKNRMVPTQEALALHPEIVQIAGQIDRLRDHARALTTESSSLLRIDCTPSIASTLLPLALEKFLRQFPNVSCYVETNAHPVIVERLMRRQTDICFALAPQPNPAVIEEVIAQGAGVCVAPVGTFSEKKASVGWSDLSKLNLIRTPARGQFGGMLLEASYNFNASNQRDLAVTTYYLALKLAEQGLGIAAIDSFTAATADRARVRVLPFDPPVPVELWTAHRFQAKLSLAARRFIQAMAHVARQAHDSHKI